MFWNKVFEKKISVSCDVMQCS